MRDLIGMNNTGNPELLCHRLAPGERIDGDNGNPLHPRQYPAHQQPDNPQAHHDDDFTECRAQVVHDGNRGFHICSKERRLRVDIVGDALCAGSRDMDIRLMRMQHKDPIPNLMTGHRRPMCRNPTHNGVAVFDGEGETARQCGQIEGQGGIDMAAVDE